MQESENIIRVEHISHAFSDKLVLDDIDLHVRKGEFVTLLGPSGCGKTTLLRIIAGFQKAMEGKLSIDGTDMTDTPPHRRPVNTVFQKYALFPHLNVYNNIAFGLNLKKLPSTTIQEKVKKTDWKKVWTAIAEARAISSKGKKGSLSEFIIKDRERHRI